LRDAARIAPARGLSFPEAAVVPGAEARRSAAGALAGAARHADAFAREELEVARALFAGQAIAAPAADGVDSLLAENARRRAKLGHYLPAMWQLDGDWFWGLDRLAYLEGRLRERGALEGEEPLAALRPADAALPSFAGRLPELEFFFSFRSPYSYLAAIEMLEFHEEWPSGVRVRPVLPMAMRGIPIPRAKSLYTLRDVRREADRRGVPFGRVADPLGDGARRCLQVFELAQSTRQQLELLVSAGSAVWAEGLDVAQDAGLRRVCERAGLDWRAARERLAADPPVDYAEENRLDLLRAGLWGVPCYRAGEFSAWGQDRFWMLREIRRRNLSRP
jgi:2-hydroxychromene-2-carboxylate isomerase